MWAHGSIDGLCGSFWQHSPWCWQREGRYDRASQRTMPRGARPHRACQAPRTEAYSDIREVHTMALAHIPNGGDGERDVTTEATDDGAARLTIVARDVPPARDALG